MNPRIIAILAVGVILMLGAQGAFTNSAIRGFGWGLGREAAHSVFRGLR